MMTPEVFTTWNAAIAIAFASVFGVVIVVFSIYRMFKALTFAVCIGLLVGLVFLTTPRWKEITLEVMGVRAKIAQLNSDVSVLEGQKIALDDRVNTLLQEKAVLGTQIAALQDLGTSAPSSAQDLVNMVASARKDVEWATFLPNRTTSFGVMLNQQTLTAEDPELQEKLGEYGREALKRIIAEGYQVIAPAADFDLTRVSARDIVITPFTPATEEQ